MIAADLLSEVVPSIHKDDKASEALNWMDVFKVSHLPIVVDNKYLGLISENDIFDYNTPDKAVMDHCLSLRRPYVLESQHIFEVIDLASNLKLSTIPVLSKEEAYLGMITITDLAQKLSGLLSTESPGAIIVLQLSSRDYSLSEISQIIEGNDAKILSLFINTPDITDDAIVTIKVNRTDVSAIIQTFERYQYHIKSIHSSNEKIDSMLEDRLNSFLNYLDI